LPVRGERRKDEKERAPLRIENVIKGRKSEKYTQRKLFQFASACAACNLLDIVHTEGSKIKPR
jgi:hypothetical protein